MRYQKNGDFEVEHFDSLGEFISAISTRPTSSNFTKRYKSIENCQSRTNGYDFTCTNNWAEADALLRDGYPDGAKAMLDEGRGIKIDTATPRRKFVIDRVGSQPHVPNAIIGIPKNMVRRVNEPKRTKTISIYYDFSANGSVSSDTLSIGGRNIYAITRYLEKRGYRVELRCIVATCKYVDIGHRGMRRSIHHKSTVTIKIKDYQQAVNPLMIAYPVAHPSFFRRHIFRWIETSQCTDYAEYTGGYGASYRTYCESYGIDIAENLRENGVIPAHAKYINCVDAARAKNVDDMLRLLKIAA